MDGLGGYKVPAASGAVDFLWGTPAQLFKFLQRLTCWTRLNSFELIWILEISRGHPSSAQTCLALAGASGSLTLVLCSTKSRCIKCSTWTLCTEYLRGWTSTSITTWVHHGPSKSTEKATKVCCNLTTVHFPPRFCNLFRINSTRFYQPRCRVDECWLYVP